MKEISKTSTVISTAEWINAWCLHQFKVFSYINKSSMWVQLPLFGTVWSFFTDGQTTNWAQNNQRREASEWYTLHQSPLTVQYNTKCLFILSLSTVLFITWFQLNLDTFHYCTILHILDAYIDVHTSPRLTSFSLTEKGKKSVMYWLAHLYSPQCLLRSQVLSTDCI